MMEPAGTKRTCPHCGKSAEGGHKTPLHLFISVLLLGAAFFFWVSGRSRLADAVNQALASDRLPSGVIAYIWSPKADKACGVCLASANNFVKGKKAAALLEKTKDMAYLPEGEYPTGSPEGLGDPDEHPLHRAHLDAFYMDIYETTIADYMKFARDTNDNYPEWAKPGSQFNIDTGKDDYYERLSTLFKTCETCPIVGVPAKSAKAYCMSQNKRLPTEAEWEAAARAGSESAFSFGETDVQAGDYAWYEVNSDGKPHPVGRKKPNKLGIYDMHGNVWEWVTDFYKKEYYWESPRRNPTGPETGDEQVIRGASWSFDADSMRSANRASTYKPNDDIGFRCAISESAL